MSPGAGSDVDGAIARDFLIINQRGLHARASAKFVQLADSFQASISVEKDGIKVGGTPSNLAISVMEAGHIEVIAGMNLPMLIKLSSVRKGGKLAAAVEEAQAAGRKYINVASQLLAAK